MDGMGNAVRIVEPSPRLDASASESGETPNFIRTIAEAAFLADAPSYALLRPVLLELKREKPRTSWVPVG
jgi:hypothetical protein